MLIERMGVLAMMSDPLFLLQVSIVYYLTSEVLAYSIATE
jgi:hypothetical protein